MAPGGGPVRAARRQVFDICSPSPGEQDTAGGTDPRDLLSGAEEPGMPFRGDSTPQVWLCAIAKRLWYKNWSAGRGRLHWRRRLSTLAASDDPVEGDRAEGGPYGTVPGHAAADGGYTEVIHLRLAWRFLLP